MCDINLVQCEYFKKIYRFGILDILRFNNYIFFAILKNSSFVTFWEKIIFTENYASKFESDCRFEICIQLCK